MTNFALRDPGSIPSPALVFCWEGIQANLQRLLSLVDSPARLRPHMKTHKTREITRLYLDRGITRHKCATLAEAQVLAECGAADVLIAYPMVGPNQELVVELAKSHPQTSFSILGDDPRAIQELHQAAQKKGAALGLFLDVNVGQDRTGAPPEQALELADRLPRTGAAPSAGLAFRGLHLYDGQNTSPDPDERWALVQKTLGVGNLLQESLAKRGLPPGRLVFGGTPAFLAYSQQTLPANVELSPGTCILHDAGYARKYPELGFQPAAAVLTRCISRPSSRLVTFDVGTKAICSDPPAGQRCVILGLEDAKAVLHNEEHLVLQTQGENDWRPGQTAYAIPAHICPTVALYESAWLARDGEAKERWPIAARNRQVNRPA
jgi:D-serine deaminase-like pyridoxal phosphate-dependent protein